ncbi:MAG: hypothetical protein M1834_002743 [Cirrosporium novae-zelandiae]|nr:MAG: hypothetical protein M1834_002743 [Cirrosporium novae-zelandiae]
MLRNKINHPPPTRWDDDDFECPPTKRRKEESLGSLSCDLVTPSLGDDQERTLGKGETEENDEIAAATLPLKGHTELEDALPPVNTDEEAIQEYKAARKAEDLPAIEERLINRSWTKGKTSIYVDAFNFALETVLDQESHLFNETENVIFEHWRNLNYEAQHLYVRLFLRKTLAWHRINRLGYHDDIANIPAAVKDLQAARELPRIIGKKEYCPEKPEEPDDIQSSLFMTFAHGSEERLTSLEDASSLLLLDELKDIAKEAKLQGKNKQELLNALRTTSKRQRGLSWTGLRCPNIPSQSAELSGKNSPTLSEGDFHEDSATNLDEYFVHKILVIIGSCIQLSEEPLKLFERVHLVFYRSTEWTENSLTTIILARISRRNFPQYIVSRSSNIFPSRALLLEFEWALRIQFEIDSILEVTGTPNEEGWQKMKDIFDDIYPRWKLCLQDEQHKEDHVYETGEGAYLRRFSPGWVYTRIVHKTLTVFARRKEHQEEYNILNELLAQSLFHAARRGVWYQRKALIEEHYMWALESTSESSKERLKKDWKRTSLQTCERGLQDRDCHLVYHHDLQKRITKLERSLKIPKREQHNFDHVRLIQPSERTIDGIRIEREQTPSRNGMKSSNKIGTKTIWIDEREGGEECSVESMCLSWYRDQGWKGYHSEGSIVRTLTAFQTCPLDLHTDSFYPSRASEINHRLAEIANGAARQLLIEVHEREFEKQTCVVGLDWSFEFEDLLEIVTCFRGEALAVLCKVMAQEYQQRGGGIPDLFLWNPRTKEVMFSEIKSENDRLSDKQRLWIHVLTGAGVSVELCNAVAREVRVKDN